MSSPTNPAAASALRWARLSRLLSWLAILVGVGFVVAFLAQAGLFASFLPNEPSAPPAVQPDQINATESTVSGMDRENQPYEVKAKRGWQDDKTPNLVHLDTVEGLFRRAAGVEYTITADTGLYDTFLKTLDLAGHVRIVQKDRFTALMEKAHVVVEEKKLTSDVPVDVTFGSGTIRANGMQITDDGARILFLNRVKAQFDAPAAKGDSKP
ncbi:LPS export ABC transporter periplasmic protein LptC [Aestuariivirga sp.]|uniref:LPS export ABC transporter periplasmic protein LptC n=1 Tax=Aestuariivirga sp. TaxID=2650926 RepID=UPI0035930A52